MSAKEKVRIGEMKALILLYLIAPFVTSRICIIIYCQVYQILFSRVEILKKVNQFSSLFYYFFPQHGNPEDQKKVGSSCYRNSGRIT